MPAGPIGTSWASGSWSDTVWEANTWADILPPGSFASILDTNTRWLAYLSSLYGYSQPQDVTTLIERWMAANPSTGDMNNRWKKLDQDSLT